MDFDIRTAILALAGSNLVFGSILALFQRDAERPQHIPFLIACKLLQGVGWLLLSGRGSIPDFLSFTVGNSCLLSGIAYECWAMYRITGRPVSRTRHVYSAVGITLICILATALTAAGRIVVASFVAAIFYALSGQALLSRPGKKSVLHGYLGGSAWLLAMVLSVRGLWALVAPENFTLFAGNTIQLITFATFYYLTLTNGVGVVLLTKQIADRALGESEARFRSYFELTLTGRAITSPDKGWIDVNTTLCEMLGYTKAELTQLTWTELTHPDDIAADFVQFNRVMAGEIDGYTLEKRFLRQDGSIVYTQIVVQCLRRPDRSVDYFVALIQDIAERRRADVALRNSKNQINQLLQTTDQGIYGIDLNGCCTFINQSGLQMLGYSLEACLGQNMHDLIHHSRADGSPYPVEECPIFRAKQTGMGYRISTEVLWRNGGTSFPAEYSSYPVIENGEIQGAVVTFSDITERKQAEAALQASEQQYRRLIDLLPSGVVVHRAGQIVLANDACARFFGADSPAQLIGTALTDRIHPDYRALADNRVQQAAQTGNAAPLIEEQLLRLDGTAFDAEVAGMPMLYDGQTAMLAVFNDVTDRKQAADALRASEAKFRAIIQQSSEGIMLLDEQGLIIEWNSAQAQITGISQVEALGQPSWELLVRQAPSAYRSPAQIEHVKQALLTMLTTGQSPLLGQAIEGTLESASGERRNIIQNNFLINTPHGYRVGAIVHDVTARKRMEDALRQSEEQLRAVVETNIDGMLVMSEQGAIHFVNPAAAALLNRSASEVLSEAFGLPIIQGQSTELELVRSDQARRVIELRATSIQWQSTPALLVSLRDITDLKRAAQLLERRASQLAIINEIGRQITAARAVHDVLDLAAQLMRERLGVQHAGIFVLDDTHAELVLRSRAGDFVHLFAADHRLKIGQGIVGWVAEHGKHLLTNDVQTEARYVNVYGAALPTRSELAVPIIIAGTVRGVLDVQSPHLNAFDQNDVLAHETLADQIAVALENARLHEAAQREIIERARAEEALRESEAMLNATGQMAKVGGWELDAATQSVKWTAETYRIHGLPAGQGPDLVEAIQFYHPADRPPLEQAIQRALERGESFDLELRFIAATGQALWVQSVGHAQWQAGRVVKLFGTFQDITERKGFEEALLLLNAQLEQRVAERTAELQAANLRLTELDHLKNEFLARIGHELRTPLTGILISLELLETAKPEKRERFMQRLKLGTDQLHAMIEDVLLFSQLNLYARSDLLSPISLNEIVASRLATWQQLSAGHTLQLQLDLAHDLPRIRTDGELIRQAINRLVINAVNYTPTGSVIVSTAPRTEGDRQWVTISVTDTGPGITPEDLPHIFERFYRGRAAADYKTPGVGVGLSISREIAEKLGGRLTVQTQVGVGSTFTLWLPASPSAG